jgi:hypothetical protein
VARSVDCPCASFLESTPASTAPAEHRCGQRTSVSQFPTPRPSDNRVAPGGQGTGVAQRRQVSHLFSGSKSETGVGVKPAPARAKPSP